MVVRANIDILIQGAGSIRVLGIEVGWRKSLSTNFELR